MLGCLNSTEQISVIKKFGETLPDEKLNLKDNISPL